MITTVPPSSDQRPCRPRATANVVMSLFPLWAHDVRGVSLPLPLLFEHVPLPPALLQHWVDSEYTALGGLLFPRDPFDMGAMEPFVQIVKQRDASFRRRHTLVGEEDAWYGARNPSCSKFLREECYPDSVTRTGIPAPIIPAFPDAPRLMVDLTLYMVRRDHLEDSPDLQPFDARKWHPVSYAVWLDLYTNLAPVLQRECAPLSTTARPLDACNYLRRVMRTHFDDCGLLFSRIWWDFGFGAMVGINLRTFMRGMLTDMFMVYYILPQPPPVRTLFNPRTCERGQRMCAHCLVLMHGTGRMMRCPCGLVYYCGADCQRADWRGHRKVCGVGSRRCGGK
jgi:hypothetical protein